MMAQGGKSQFLFNIMGYKLDDDPEPVLYISPTKSNITKAVEPKIDQMLRGCESLWRKTIKGMKYTTLKKLVGGTSLRMAWAGSTTEIKSDTAAVVMVDEIDEIEIERQGQGSIIPLADARHKVYPDGITLGASTPTVGTIQTKVLDSGIEHWLPSSNVQSPIWKLWQAGTMHEWAVPCLSCKTYFVPRFKLLKWAKGTSPVEAMEDKATWIECPNCNSKIYNEARTTMNILGIAVSPHQKVSRIRKVGDTWVKGRLSGEGISSTDYTLWVSGLCNPFRPLGHLASNWIRAVRSQDDEEVKGVLNTDFGECYAMGGEAPSAEEVKAHRSTYRVGEIPKGIRLVVAGVDVQKNRLYYVVRGFGFAYESWLLQYGEIWGDTDGTEVWTELEALLDTPLDDHYIKRMGVDSAYRKDEVYTFCSTRKSVLKAVRGHKVQDKPYYGSKVEVDKKGRTLTRSLMLWHFCTDTAKSWVHGRIGRDESLGGKWHLPSNIDQDYCDQIVAEERIEKRGGGFEWMRVAKNNHYLDCEGIAYIMARMSHTSLMMPDKKPKPETKKTPFSSIKRQKPTKRKKSFVKNW